MVEDTCCLDTTPGNTELLWLYGQNKIANIHRIAGTFYRVALQ